MIGIVVVLVKMSQTFGSNTQHKTEMLSHVQLGLSEYDRQYYEGAKEHFRSALLMLEASPSTFNDVSYLNNIYIYID
ncbi:hypothetical protein M0802_017022 [Mischocyttarus mexicanus]|nr:hypothetical protein M0802_017022 [Mischocyttarus mexicanus]